MLVDQAVTLFGKGAGKVGRMISKDISVVDENDPAPCVNITFFYHAYGFHLGELKAKVRRAPYTSGWIDIFDKIGQDQFNYWRLAQYMLPGIENSKSIQIMFEATTGDGPQGNYAIDDVQVRTISCRDDGNVQVGTTGTQVIFHATTPASKSEERMEGWIIALIVVSILFVIGGIGVTVFILKRQKQLKIEKEYVHTREKIENFNTFLFRKQDAEKAERLKKEIEQYGTIKARLDRTISGRVHQIQQQNEREMTFDRPPVDRRFIKSAMPATRGAIEDVSEDHERSEAVFSILTDSRNPGKPRERLPSGGIDDRSEAVFEIIGSSYHEDKPQRAKSAIARGVHSIDNKPSNIPQRLPPLASSATVSPNVTPVTPRKLKSTSSGRVVRFDSTAEKKNGGKSEKMDWFDD